LLLREVEERLRLADRLAGCLTDPRNQAQVAHTLAETIRFRMLAIVGGIARWLRGSVAAFREATD
jgi:hypothetical protein